MDFNQAVLLVGGKSTRINSPKYGEKTKVLLKLGGKPILQRNIEILRDQLDIKLFYLIVGNNKKIIKEFFGSGEKFGIKIEYIESNPSHGIADGLYTIKNKIQGKFILMLGDEFYLNFDHSTLKNITDKNLGGVITFIQSTNPQSILNNYSINTNDDMKILTLEEKPLEIINDMLGLGTFVLFDTIFDYIEKTDVNPRTKRKEIVDVISKMAQDKTILAHQLHGTYVNINTNNDWLFAKYLYNQQNFSTFKKSLVIPVYNEVNSITFVLDDFKDVVDEIIVADGGSTDESLEKIKNFNHPKVKLIQKNFLGYGDALRNGIDFASGDIIILVEGDATFRSRDIFKMYEYIKDCDMVMGTRTTRELIAQGANMNSKLRFGNLILAKIIEVLWWNDGGSRLTDVGCTFRLFWKSEYDSIKNNFIATGPEFSPEMMIEFLRNNKRIIEIPVSYYKRIGGTSKHSESIVSIAKTGFKMLGLIIKKKFK
jgi:dTDP-glucose pyrophosphorylase